MFALIRDGRVDPPVSLAEVPEPEPAEDEAVVEVRASSLNRGELALLAARPDGWRPGQDLAGVVTQAAASGEGPGVGTRVVGVAEGGAWSERVAVAAGRLTALEEGVSFEDAATLGIAGRTALNIVRLAGPILGRRVLILGASGGVGHLAVQLAAAAGARVTAHVLAGEEPEPSAFDVVLDGVGGASLGRAVRAIRPGGTIVLFGATDPEPATLTLLDFIGHEGARIQTYFSYAQAHPNGVAGDLRALAELLQQGRVKPTIGVTVDWRDADRALVALRSGEVAGKVVLTFPARSRTAEEEPRTVAAAAPASAGG